MKILHVIPSLATGGAEKLLVDLLPRLLKDGYEVDAAIMNPRETVFMRVLESRGVRIIKLKQHRSYLCPLYLVQIARLMNEYDIIHSHLSSPQLFVAIANHFAKKTIITTEHSTSNRRRKILFLRWVERYKYNQYDVVTCITDAVRIELEAYLKKSRADMITIENGIPIDVFKGTQNNRHMVISQKEKIVLTMVGSFREQKDQDTIVCAMAILPRSKYELWLIGDGPRRKDIEGLVARNGVEKNVVFWGVRSDIPVLLENTDVVIMSSHNEGFGLAAVEGMAAGKPVIASDVPGLADIVRGAGMLFCAGDYRDLASKIQYITTNDSEYAEMSARCMKRAQKYDISRMVVSFESLYDEIKRKKQINI